MRDLASPVAAFVREKCEVGVDKEIETDVLYDAFKIWCAATSTPRQPSPFLPGICEPLSLRSV